MKRRNFLVLGGATVAAWARPAMAQAQQALPKRRDGKPWLIAALINMTEAQSDYEVLGPFRKAMTDLGYAEGRDYKIEARFADGDATRLPSQAQELVELKPDLILAPTSGSGPLLQSLPVTIPIITAIATADIVGLVGSNLAHPNRNVTGLLSTGTNGIGLEKYCELALELVPGAMRVGILVWSLAADGGALARAQVATAAAALKFTPVIVEVAQPSEIEAAFRSLAAARVDVVVVGNGSAFAADRPLTVAAAAAAKLPTIYNQAGYPQAGGLLSFGGDRRVASTRLASFVDLIFRGAKPSDLPVEQSTNPLMSINLKTAKALGLTIPPSVLFRADEVIE